MKITCILKKFVKSFKEFLRFVKSSKEFLKELNAVTAIMILIGYALYLALTLSFPKIFIPLNIILLLIIIYFFYQDFKEECEQ